MKLTVVRLAFVASVAVGFIVAYLPSSSAQVKGRFSHTEPKHQTKSCASCHMMPTANALTVRGLPDVAQFPGHASGFNCHTSAVLMGAKIGGKPAFCLG